MLPLDLRKIRIRMTHAVTICLPIMGRSKTICRRIEMLNALSINKKKSAIDAPIQTVSSLGRCRLISKTNIHKAGSSPRRAIWIYFATAGNRNAKGCFLGRLRTLPRCPGYVDLDQELCSSHVVRHAEDSSEWFLRRSLDKRSAQGGGDGWQEGRDSARCARQSPRT